MRITHFFTSVVAVNLTASSVTAVMLDSEKPKTFMELMFDSEWKVCRDWGHDYYKKLDKARDVIRGVIELGDDLPAKFRQDDAYNAELRDRIVAEDLLTLRPCY